MGLLRAKHQSLTGSAWALPPALNMCPGTVLPLTESSPTQTHLPALPSGFAGTLVPEVSCMFCITHSTCDPSSPTLRGTGVPQQGGKWHDNFHSRSG